MKPRDIPLRRPDFDDIWAGLAHDLSRRSTCRRLSVGCVIVSSDNQRVLSLGYNGGAAGQANDCDSEEPGKCGCVHAEANAIVKCAEPTFVAKRVYCTDLPCAMCAKLLVNLGGVVRVVYGRDYRLRDGVDILQRASIAVERRNPAFDSDRDLREALINLTSVQARCTELLLENRALKGERP